MGHVLCVSHYWRRRVMGGLIHDWGEKRHDNNRHKRWTINIFMRLVCGGIQLNAKILTPLEPHMLYCMYQLKPLGTSISQCCSDSDRFHSCFSIGWHWGRMHCLEKGSIYRTRIITKHFKCWYRLIRAVTIRATYDEKRFLFRFPRHTTDWSLAI